MRLSVGLLGNNHSRPGGHRWRHQGLHRHQRGSGSLSTERRGVRLLVAVGASGAEKISVQVRGHKRFIAGSAVRIIRGLPALSQGRTRLGNRLGPNDIRQAKGPGITTEAVELTKKISLETMCAGSAL